MNQSSEVVVLLGAGAIGLEIVRRLATNKILLLGDIRQNNLDSAKADFENAGFTVVTESVDGGNRASIQAFADKARQLGVNQPLCSHSWPFSQSGRVC